MSAKVATLAKGVLQAMTLTKLKVATALLIAVGLAFAAAGLIAHQAVAAKPTEAKADDEPKPAARNAAQPKPEAAKTVRTDLFGDPLPPGALARMGTIRFRQGGEIGQIAFSSNSKMLAGASDDGAVYLWDPATGKEIRRIENATAGFRPGVAFSPDGEILASAYGEEVRRWDAATGKELTRFTLQSARAGNLIFSPDGKVLVALGTEQRENYNVIVFLDAESGKELHHLMG
jgi:hypothetical protein